MGTRTKVTVKNTAKEARHQAVIRALRRASQAADDPFELRERKIYHHAAPTLRCLTNLELQALMTIYDLQDLHVVHRTRDEIIEREIIPHLRNLNDVQIDQIVNVAREMCRFGEGVRRAG